MADYSVKYDNKYTITKSGKTITVYQKIMPNDFKAPKYVASYVKKGQPMKACRTMRTGRVLGITIHNTGDIPRPLNGIKSAAEQYILSTYNGNMAGAMVHYYVSDSIVWQLLNDNEQGWHSGTGNATKIGNRGTQIGGNIDTIAIECIGGSAGAEKTTAILAAYLCDKHGLNPDLDIYTHKFWSGKQCPLYILPHWDDFISSVKRYGKPSADNDKISLPIKVGDRVKVKKPFIYGTDRKFTLWHKVYDVIAVSGERVVIGIGKTVTAAIHINNIECV